MLNRVTLPLEAEILKSGERTLDDPVAQIRNSYVAALRATVAASQMPSRNVRALRDRVYTLAVDTAARTLRCLTITRRLPGWR